MSNSLLVPMQFLSQLLKRSITLESPHPLSQCCVQYTNQWQMYYHSLILLCSSIYSCIEREEESNNIGLV